jgi:hypothetical protein
MVITMSPSIIAGLLVLLQLPIASSTYLSVIDECVDRTLALIDHKSNSPNRPWMSLRSVNNVTAWVLLRSKYQVGCPLRVSPFTCY